MSLTPFDHDRDAAGLTYVYPVLSRRAGGLSVGINLNPNRACTWRCVYCQVPGLQRGKGPPIDLDRLRTELSGLLEDVVHGDFLARSLPEGSRHLRDVAFSGDGEPTSSPQFAEAIDVVGEVLARYELVGRINVVLITNGSLIERVEVQRGLDALAALGGEAWFKLDTATAEGFVAVHDTPTEPARHLRRLATCASHCPTWVQTCAFARAGAPPSEVEQQAYLDALADAVEAGVALRGVLLYGLARPSHQPEAPELSALPAAWLEAYGERITTRTGLEVRVSV